MSSFDFHTTRCLTNVPCRHKYTLFLSADGNFRLQRKNKRGDSDDVALNKGNAYFMETEEFKKYLQRVKALEDLGTCALVHICRPSECKKNAVISGVIAVQCARHGFYMPQSMVDLTKGEAFANMDYVLSHTLLEVENQRWIMLSYDIWCQYRKNFRKWFDESFPEQAKLLDCVRGAIPKMHVKNHVASCQQLYSFNY
ncbi:hypothetical protein SCLCIDRAFT_125607 [Scleroderma citrinum Foug A]|uniref:CxC2-like cysteine cluster KDZ transposase-associated domain-containing protein n=1 Tax=Scleroderma citrinum Foug A TaxID=1036808 RepID=A0A0C3DUY1_9AGAM|nr:hypothetical protein SCLCIDRAFT_125607 [Scleroderma citrinum Foug A]